MTCLNGFARFLLMSVFALATPASRCEAEPPPLPEEKMWEYSDAIVWVDVLSLTRTAEKGRQKMPIFLVKFRVCKVRKGDLKVGHVFHWEMADYQPALGEYGGGVCYPGERYLLYLEQRPGGSYNTWGHNCSQCIASVAYRDQLFPQHPGQIVVAYGFDPPLETK